MMITCSRSACCTSPASNTGLPIAFNGIRSRSISFAGARVKGSVIKASAVNARQISQSAGCAADRVYCMLEDSVGLLQPGVRSLAAGKQVRSQLKLALKPLMCFHDDLASLVLLSSYCRSMRTSRLQYSVPVATKSSVSSVRPSRKQSSPTRCLWGKQEHFASLEALIAKNQAELREQFKELREDFKELREDNTQLRDDFRGLQGVVAGAVAVNAAC